MNFSNLLADRTRNMGSSAIRELLKVVEQPGMISLGGGIPAPESFPLQLFDDLTSQVLKKYSSNALQYGPSEGFRPLREALVVYLKKSDIRTSVDNITITCGSQGVLDSIGKILISKGDKIAVEAPTYIGALSAFNPYEPEYIALETDYDGVIPESLEKALKHNKIKFVYLIPTFQNPTGRTIPLERRKKIAEIIRYYNALLLEDDPYSSLRYRGEAIPAIKTMAPDNVLYTSTFSKILAPGLRIGFSVGPELITKWMVLAKQGIDLHTNTFSQALAAEYIEGGHLDKHLPRILSIYKPKQEAMLNALAKYFPGNFQWSKPAGGMFIWAEGPSGFSTEKLYCKALERKVAILPGQYFYPHPGMGLETMRLNFTMMDAPTIDKAIKILSEVIKEELSRVSMSYS
jgi:2-aminoadipate transaminase